MVNIASILKSEIARVARKEVRAEIESLKKANTQYRGAIAQLRRELADVQKQLKQRGRQVARQSREASAATPVAGNANDGITRRFSASRLAAHRAKLEISAASYGKLVGVSDQTIYNWEQGKTRPDAGQLLRVAAVRELGKRDVAERLAKTDAPSTRARKSSGTMPSTRSSKAIQAAKVAKSAKAPSASRTFAPVTPTPSRARRAAPAR